jgi:hypothetical protein
MEAFDFAAFEQDGPVPPDGLSFALIRFVIVRIPKPQAHAKCFGPFKIEDVARTSQMASSGRVKEDILKIVQTVATRYMVQALEYVDIGSWLTYISPRRYDSPTPVLRLEE